MLVNIQIAGLEQTPLRKLANAIYRELFQLSKLKILL